MTKGSGPNGEPSISDNRRCHRCQKEGHIAKNCPNPREAEPILPASTKVDPLAGQRTKDVVCAGCKKGGHTIAQCWKEHPEQIPEAIQKRRANEMSAQSKKKLRS